MYFAVFTTYAGKCAPPISHRASAPAPWTQPCNGEYGRKGCRFPSCRSGRMIQAQPTFAYGKLGIHSALFCHESYLRSFYWFYHKTADGIIHRKNNINYFAKFVI